MTESTTHGSMATRVGALAVGESLPVARRLQLAAGERDISGTADKLRDSLSAPVARTKSKYDNREFRIETGNFSTRSNDIMVCAVVTRIA